MQLVSVAAIALLAASAAAQTAADECYNLYAGVFFIWGFLPESQPPYDCCTGKYHDDGTIVCDATNTYITELHLRNTSIKGQAPPLISRLTHLTFLDISENPQVNSGLSSLALIPALKTINIAGTGFKGPTALFSQSVTCTLTPNLCGNPGCQQLGTPLAPCPTTAVLGNDNPADFVSPTASPVFWALLGVFGSAFVLLSLMCFCCNQRGAVARRMLEQGGVPASSEKQQNAGFVAAGNQQEYQDNSEMAMITLSRNGIPKRTFSLPETRKLQSKEEAQLDVTARDPFINANGGTESFPVRRFYVKEFGDELSLTEGDSVVLTKVFRDGWAEGVSMRAGGPALFPLACLGGGVPIVLAERLRVARAMAQGSTSAA
ncbi:hypothetical protein HDU79_003911 [Rhizoclosmatium sp. JEL0117]|nr:hypothetical protein HDU79_003911 [Rhizoclosmatium sp. JEL0117]